MPFIEKLNKIISRFEYLDSQLQCAGLSGNEYAKIGKEHAEITEIVKISRHYLNRLSVLADLKSEISSIHIDGDVEWQKMVEQEIIDLTKEVEVLEIQLKCALIPKDFDDEKNAMIEIRAGTGGEEAALFVAVLFRMYSKYAELQGWKLEIIGFSSTGLDGYKEISAIITGKGVFAKLKFESGVHRVQRIPETESSGRIHTSAATVAVLPEAQEIDIHIDEKDLEIDVFRASGAGGQHVNTTDSAVRIKHKPSGLVVVQQDDRSQHKNKARALKILRSRLYEMEREKKQNERAATRKSQIGSGDRSERIRTYNFPQGRMTDHRINFTSYNLLEIVNEGKLDSLINALILEDNMEKIGNSNFE